MEFFLNGVGNAANVEQQVREVFVEIGVPEAAEMLLALMRVAGPIDDARLLEIVALYQEKRDLEAMFLLRSLLAPPAALVARRHAERLAAALTASGHLLAASDRPAMQRAALVG